MDPEDVLALIARHASCRSYSPHPVPDGLVESLVEAAQQTSTDATGQMYSVVRLVDPALRARAAVLSGDQKHVREAPEFLVFCLDLHRMERLLESRGLRLGMKPAVGLLFGVTDVALFAQSLVLAAEAHGLGCCYIGGVQNGGAALARLLDLPPRVVPLWGLTLGHPDKELQVRPRVPTVQVLHKDRYHEVDAARVAAAFDAMAATTRSGDWGRPLEKYFAEGGVMDRREQDFRDLLAQQRFAL